MSVQFSEVERVHFFFPHFCNGVALVKERKVKGEWSVCKPLFYLPKNLVKKLAQIGIIDEKDFVHIEISLLT